MGEISRHIRRAAFIATLLMAQQIYAVTAATEEAAQLPQAEDIRGGRQTRSLIAGGAGGASSFSSFEGGFGFSQSSGQTVSSYPVVQQSVPVAYSQVQAVQQVVPVQVVAAIPVQQVQQQPITTGASGAGGFGFLGAGGGFKRHREVLHVKARGFGGLGGIGGFGGLGGFGGGLGGGFGGGGYKIHYRSSGAAAGGGLLGGAGFLG